MPKNIIQWELHGIASHQPNPRTLCMISLELSAYKHVYIYICRLAGKMLPHSKKIPRDHLKHHTLEYLKKYQYERIFFLSNRWGVLRVWSWFFGLFSPEN